MKLKLPLSVGVLVLAASLAPSCANQAQPFTISKFYPLAPGCDYTTYLADYVTGNGYLDVAAGNAQYFVGLKVSGAEQVTQSEVAVSGQILERANRNRPLVNQMVVNYRLSKRVGATPKPYLSNISLPFSEAGEIVGPFQLISPELALQLYDGLNPSPGVAPSSVIEDFVDISVDVEFNGEFSATRSPFTTGVLTLPIRAYRSNPIACPAGYVKYVNLTGSADGGVPAYDFCNYVGQTSSQILAPPTPSCCDATNPQPGSGC